MKRILQSFQKIDIWLVGILLLGGILRLVFLSDIPSGLHRDEAQSGYNGFLIAKHLKNIHGEFLPTDIDYYGDYRPAVHSYLTAFPIKLFGVKEWAIRLPAALAGIATILLVYILALILYREKQAARLTSLFLALSPLHIVFSRGSADGIIDIFWTLAALICLDVFLKKWGIRWLALCYGLWILGFFTYPTSRVLLPLLTLLYLLCFSLTKRLPRWKLQAVLGALVLYLLFPWAFYLASGKAAGRFNQVSIFSFPEVKRHLNQTITESGVIDINPYIVRIFHNKPIAYFRDIAFRHLTFFSPSVVLFDTTRPERFRVPDLGMITLWEYFGLFPAAYFLVKKKAKAKIWFPLIALALAPLPSSLTFEDYPNFQRAIYLIPFWQLTAGWGWWQTLTAVRGRRLTILLSLAAALFLFQTSFFCYQYYLIAPVHEPFHRDYERKELAGYLYSVSKRYQEIGLSTWYDTYIFYLLFNQLDVFDLKTSKQGKYFQGDFTIENLHFLKDKCIEADDFLEHDYDLVIQLEECLKYSFNKPIREFRRKDGSLALVAYETDKDLLRDYRQEQSQKSVDQLE